MNLQTEYQKNGYVSVPGIFTRQQAQAIKADAIRILTRDDKLGTPSGVNVWMLDQIDPSLLQPVIDPRLVGILRELIGQSPEFLSAKSVFKSGTKRFPSPWHQDWFYWKGSAKISAWIALDDATEANGCLRLIPGTHRKVFTMAQIKNENGFEWQIPAAELEGLEPVTVPATAGDVVFFHDLAVHASHPNTSGDDRWSLISTYRDRSEPDESTAWSTSLPL